MSGGKNKLPRKYSLKSRRDIQWLLKNGKRRYGEFLTCVWEKSDRFELGLFIPRRYGSAVERNRLKRLCREVVRLNRNRLISPVRIGLFPGKGIKNPRFESLDAEIIRMFDLINKAEK